MPDPRIALFLPSLAGGGAERVFVDLANEFVTLGLHTDLVLARAEGPYLDELSQAVRVVDLHASGVLRASPGLVRYLRSARPTTMLSGLHHANVTSILARLISATGTRSIISMRSVSTVLFREEAGEARASNILHIARLVYRFAHAFIANSDAVALDLARFLHIPRSSINVVYNPLHLASIERLSREPVGHPWCVPDAIPIILSVGRLTALKDFPTLLHAFSLARSRRPCRLVLLGEGPDRARLEHEIQRLKLERDVYMPGFVTNPFSWMRRSGVFVSSSISEGCPNALMQALACGVPVISTNCVGGSAEILENGKWGRLVAVGDAVAMANAIVGTLDAVTHPQVRQRASDFGHNRIALQYLQVLLPEHFGSGRGR